jgi:hypothetical protein
MNVQQYKNIAAVMLTALIPSVLSAQNRNASDTTFKGQSLDFYSTYKPEIAPAPKPVFVPTLPVVDTSKPTLQYVVPEQTISYTYKAEPIKPLALKRAKEKLPFENYAQIGIGSQGSFLLDAGIGSLIGDNYDASIHFNHLSQRGKYVENQKWSQNTLDAAGNFYFPKHTLNVGLQADRRAYRQYGYNNNFYTFEDKDVRNVYSGMQLSAGLTPGDNTWWNLKYKPTARLYWCNSEMGASEINFDFALPVSKEINQNLTASFAVNGGLASYVPKGASGIANNFIQFNPALDIKYEGFEARIGIKPTFASTNNFVLPDLHLSGKLFEGDMKLYAGWQGNLEQHLYRSMTLYNPFMEANYQVQQGRLSHVYGGFESSLGSHITIGAALGYKMWNNLAMYQNDYTSSIDGRQFEAYYRDVNAFVVDAKFQYMIGEQFSLLANSEWHFYDVRTGVLNERVQHMPQLALRGGFSWTPLSKLGVGADLIVYDRMFARNANGLVQKLNTIFDLNANASYEVHERVALFVKVNNILNQRYQFWNQYPSLGFMAMGGLRFKF